MLPVFICFFLSFGLSSSCSTHLFFRVECKNCGPGVSFSPASETISSTYLRVRRKVLERLLLRTSWSGREGCIFFKNYFTVVQQKWSFKLFFFFFQVKSNKMLCIKHQNRRKTSLLKSTVQYTPSPPPGNNFSPKIDGKYLKYILLLKNQWILKKCF